MSQMSTAQAEKKESSCYHTIIIHLNKVRDQMSLYLETYK